DYDFGELLPASIEGNVRNDDDGNCTDGNDENDKPIAGVTIQLLNQSGQIVRTTTTDEAGHYQFTDLVPGIYAVHELQPAGYLQGDQNAGSGRGDASVTDLISPLAKHCGAHLVEYDVSDM